ncbi:MAG: hypothetical protein ACJZ85_03640 [Pontiellaceae bacterium]
MQLFRGVLFLWVGGIRILQLRGVIQLNRTVLLAMPTIHGRLMTN